MHAAALRRSTLALVLATTLLALTSVAAFARPTPTQFSSLMQKALLAKASTYHLNKTTINNAFNNPMVRANLYNAGAIICQKLATETPKKAAADLVAFTTSLAGGGVSGTPLPLPSTSHPVSASVFRGIVGVGLTVATAKGSLCPGQKAKAASTLKLYNVAVKAK